MTNKMEFPAKGRRGRSFFCFVLLTFATFAASRDASAQIVRAVSTIEALVALNPRNVQTPEITVRDLLRGGNFRYDQSSTKSTNIFDTFAAIGGGNWIRVTPAGADIRVTWGAATGSDMTMSTLQAALYYATNTGIAKVVIPTGRHINLTFATPVYMPSGVSLFAEEGNSLEQIIGQTNKTAIIASSIDKSMITGLAFALSPSGGNVAVAITNATSCIFAANQDINHGTLYAMGSGNSTSFFFDTLNRADTPEAFGAARDGVIDDTAPLQTWVTWGGAAGRVLRVPPGLAIDYTALSGLSSVVIFDHSNAAKPEVKIGERGHQIWDAFLSATIFRDDQEQVGSLPLRIYNFHGSTNYANGAGIIFSAAGSSAFGRPLGEIDVLKQEAWPAGSSQYKSLMKFTVSTNGGTFPALTLDSEGTMWLGNTNRSISISKSAISPVGNRPAKIGSIHFLTTGGSGTTMFVKESDSGSGDGGTSGWVPYFGGGAASDNWFASGTTNSTLAGIAKANGLVGTNDLYVGNTIYFGSLTNIWSVNGPRTIYKYPGSPGIRLMEDTGTAYAEFQKSGGTATITAYDGSSFANLAIVAGGLSYVQPSGNVGTSNPFLTSQGFGVATTGQAVTNSQQSSPALFLKGSGWDGLNGIQASVYVGTWMVPVQVDASYPESTIYWMHYAVNGSGSSTNLMMSLNSNSGYTGAGTKYFSDDGNFKTYTGGVPGTITGSGLTTDNAIVRVDGTGGTNIQNSVVLLSDSGAITQLESVTATNAIAGGTLTSEATITAATAITGASANITNSLRVGGLPVYGHNGTPVTLSMPIWLAWSNGPTYLTYSGISEDFLSGGTATIMSAGVTHVAGSATQTFTIPSATTYTGRNGFLRSVLTAPGGSVQYAAITWGDGTYELWDNTYFNAVFTIETCLTNILVQLGQMNQVYSASNCTKGVFWELDQTKSPNWIARTEGTSSWAWTNSSAAALNTFYDLGYYGNTNTMIFTINGSPVATNTTSSTMPSYSFTGYHHFRHSNSMTNNTGGASSIIYLDKVQWFDWR